MYKPETIDCSPAELSVETIEQHYFTVDQGRKFDLLLRLIEQEQPKQAIVFCRTKRGTERIHNQLSQRIKGTACIHGDMQQRARDRVMSQFREGKVRYLVATDVVGRGIDVSSISHIINYDIPQFCDDYVHRVGRTGRMGRKGESITFITPEEGRKWREIERGLNRQFTRQKWSAKVS